MTSISPAGATTYYGYSLAGMPSYLTAPTPPLGPMVAPSTSSAPSTPVSDQVAMASLALESQMANGLLGAAPSSTASDATPTFFSNAAMFTMLGTQGSAVAIYLNSQAAAPAPTVDATI